MLGWIIAFFVAVAVIRMLDSRGAEKAQHSAETELRKSIAQLDELRSDDLISQSEYDSKKADLLKKRSA